MLAFFLDDEKYRQVVERKAAVYSEIIEVKVHYSLMRAISLLFPDEFELDRRGYLKPKLSLRLTMDHVRRHFGLNQTEFMHLFCIELQSVGRYGGKKLSEDSVVQDVGDNILDLLRKQGLFNDSP